MHKIKSHAKRAAWYSDDGSMNLNPFGKLWREGPRHYRAHNPEGDAENGLGLSRAVSDGEALGLSSGDKRRRSQFEGNNVQYASTMPSNVATAASGSHSAGQGDALEVEKTDRQENSQASGAGTSETIVPDGVASNGHGGVDETEGKPRRRFIGGLLGGRKNKEPEKEEEQDSNGKKKQTFTVWSQFQHTIFNSWINVLLIMAPVGIALNYVPSVSKIVVFVVNFIAIIPLAGLLSYATEEIALRTGETIGGLINASFGNAVELIVSIVALFSNQIIIVQTSLVGSMLSNLLLVMGMCFFFGGLNKVEQHFNVTVAQTAASLLALAIGSLIIPTVYNELVGDSASSDPIKDDTTPPDPHKQEHITQMSRGTAILLLCVYGCYLFFQLRTHAGLYSEPSAKAQRRKPKPGKGDAMKNLIQAGNLGAGNTRIDEIQVTMKAREDEEDEPDDPKLSLTSALITLAGSTVLVALCAEFMVDSIDAVATPQSGVSKEFVGLILLPIVGNAAEHATAVTVAVKDKMDLAIGVAVGSSMQIALLVIPLVVTIGWIAGKDDMTLAFDGFQIIVLFVAVLLVNYLIADGKSHWLEGVLLQTLYLIIAIAAWFYPTLPEK